MCHLGLPWCDVNGPSIVRPRKEAPKERLEILGPNVNLVGIGSETPSCYLRTRRTADLGDAHTHHQNPSEIESHDLAIVTDL